MIVIALLLMGAAAALTVGVLLAGAEPAQLNVFSASVNTNSVQVFLAGVATGLVFLLGLGLFRAALKRGAHRRRERRTLVAEHKRTVHELEQEKRQAEEEKERLRERLSSSGDSSTDTTDVTQGPRHAETPKHA